jgi:hypothetical protein
LLVPFCVVRLFFENARTVAASTSRNHVEAISEA